MTLPFSPGERRRLFLALCAIAFLGAVAIFVAALFNAKPAHAEVLAMPQSGSGWSACNRYGVCQWGDGALPDGPRIINVPQPSSQDDEAVQKWENDCDVKLVRGQYGVMRYTYNAPGCEYGSHP